MTRCLSCGHPLGLSDLRCPNCRCDPAFVEAVVRKGKLLEQRAAQRVEPAPLPDFEGFADALRRFAGSAADGDELRRLAAQVEDAGRARGMVPTRRRAA